MEQLLHERTPEDEIQLIWAENTQSINICVYHEYLNAFPRLCPTLGTGDVRPKQERWNIYAAGTGSFILLYPSDCFDTWEALAVNPIARARTRMPPRWQKAL